MSLLGIDVGTTGCKAVAFDESGRIIASAYREYPLHFPKTYFPGRLHGEPSVEYENQLAASRIIPVAPPLGYAPDVFRACLVPGTPYARLTPFRGEPPENDLPKARRLELAPAAGLYRLCEEAFHHLAALHAAGLAHGDAELHNLIVCPSPLEIVVIDFESAIRREVLTPEAWAARVEADRVPLLREAVFLQCALGRQRGPLADVAFERTDALFKDGARFRRAIEDHAELD